MNRKKLIAVVGVLFLAVGFSAVAAPEPEEATTVEAAGTATVEWAQPDWLAAVDGGPNRCTTSERKTANANLDDPDYDDPCVECWLDCWEEFRECRRNCPWASWPCLDECVTQEITV